MSTPLPEPVAAMAARDDAWAAWVDALPRTLAGVLADWALVPDGAPTHGETALVVPVRTASGRPAMLKIAGPPPELDHEHLALQAWGGTGAVTLLRADPHRRALLLERLWREDLGEEWDVAAAETIGGLLLTLRRPALPQLRPLTDYLRDWRTDLTAATAASLPRRLVDQATHLIDGFRADDTPPALLHGDLHYANVLDSDRGWLAIDPQPMAGNPHYEVAPVLTNRLEELEGDLRGGLRRRFWAVVEAAELDDRIARDFTIVRTMLDAAWCLQDADRAGRGQHSLTAEERAYVTARIAIAKAVQD